jgi:hypothetical protein
MQKRQEDLKKLILQDILLAKEKFLFSFKTQGRRKRVTWKTRLKWYDEFAETLEEQRTKKDYTVNWETLFFFFLSVSTLLSSSLLIVQKDSRRKVRESSRITHKTKKQMPNKSKFEPWGVNRCMWCTVDEEEVKEETAKSWERKKVLKDRGWMTAFLLPFIEQFSRLVTQESAKESQRIRSRFLFSCCCDSLRISLSSSFMSWTFEVCKPESLESRVSLFLVKDGENDREGNLTRKDIPWMWTTQQHRIQAHFTQIFLSLSLTTRAATMQYLLYGWGLLP